MIVNVHSVCSVVKQISVHQQEDCHWQPLVGAELFMSLEGEREHQLIQGMPEVNSFSLREFQKGLNSINLSNFLGSLDCPAIYCFPPDGTRAAG
jgi:hypothetical protein